MNSNTPPVVSYCLLAYNQAEYVRVAVESALRQTYFPLEIILSDDASTDGTFEAMHKIVAGYNGKHKIRLNRNDSNLGLVSHVNKMFEISTGELVILAAGDDIALPRRAELLVKRWLDSGKKAMAICSGYREMDSAGNPGRICRVKVASKSDWCLLKMQRMFWYGCTAAYARVLFDRFGGICHEATEDTVFYRRALMSGGVVYVDEPLIDYRIGVGISTQKSELPIRKRIRKLSWQLNLARQMMEDFQRTDIPQTRNDIVRWWKRYLQKKELQLLFVEEPLILRRILRYFRLLGAFPLLGIKRIVLLFVFPPPR